jgi:hypothetical protein
MNRIHVLIASVLVALAAAFGVAAMVKSAGLGSSTSATAQKSNAQFAARRQALNRAELALRRARAKKPPALPGVPAVPQRTRQVLIARAPAPPTSSSHSFDDEHEDEEGEHDD